MQRCVAYLRVSGREQTVENQRPALLALAAQHQLTISDWPEEQRSAVKRRPVWESVLKAARSRQVSTLLVWALDRLGRSLVDTFLTVSELDACGVRVISYSEPWLDTHAPTRGLLLAIFAWVAEQERHRLIERTLAGLEHARTHGTRSGRPIGRESRTTPEQAASVCRARAAGLSWSRTAQEAGTTIATARRLATRGACKEQPFPLGGAESSSALPQSVPSGKPGGAA